MLCAILAVSCTPSWQKGNCKINLSFSDGFPCWAEEITRGGGGEIPDTNKFILSIKESDGEEIYYGEYQKRPNEIVLEEGVYEFGVFSREFDGAEFDAPQYGEIIEATAEGKELNIQFNCKQLNCGIRLIFGEDFKGRFPSSVIVLKDENNTLNYPYTEERIAYFQPGIVEIILKNGDTNRHLLARDLKENQVLGICFSVDPTMGESSAEFTIAIDTGRVWINEKFVYGKENDGSSISKALPIADAMNMTGSEDVWVKGYIVGGDLTSTAASYTTPFTSATHFMISDKKGATSREGCMSVELKSGKIRESLNLVDNPKNLGKLIYLKGKIVESYFGLRGIKGVTDFQLE